MAKRRAFKDDDDFLSFLAMGAHGTRQVLANLSQQGHRPLLLDRGSSDFKIWKQTRIKGVRVPDILCVNNGRRIESRAKAEFEISGSHSTKDPQRTWDYGMNEGDYLALPVCSRCGDRPIDWQVGTLVQYVSYGDLRQTFDHAFVTEAKGVQQGSEKRVIWPSSIASSSGHVTQISADRIQYCTESGRTITLKLVKKGQQLTPRVAVAQNVVTNQVLASVVQVTTTVPLDPPVGVDHYLRDLESMSQSVRFAAAKALRLFQSGGIDAALLAHMDNPEEHIFVRLEAAGSLISLRQEQGWSFLVATLADQHAAHRLEAVIVLAEIDDPRARRLLLDVLMHAEQPADVRAGAAWALGEHRDSDALGALVAVFADSSQDVRIEAARALAKIAPKAQDGLLDAFKTASEETRPGVAWALSKSGFVNIGRLLPTFTNADARQWAAFIIGTQDRQKFIADIEQLKNGDPEVYFAVTVLWKILSNWVFDLKDFG